MNFGKTCAGGGRLNTELVKTDASRFDSFSASPVVAPPPAAAEACCEVEIEATVAVARPPARKDRRQEVVHVGDEESQSVTTTRPGDGWFVVWYAHAHDALWLLIGKTKKIDETNKERP